MNDVLAPAAPTPHVVPPSASPQGRIGFILARNDFRRLVLRGALLELITVGFYRFWLATDMRRHLWSHTAAEGDAPEYTGTAKELLIGFLFALAILVPIYVVYFLIGIEAERIQAFLSTPLGLFYYLFIQFAVYRARRYRLTRTVWRGVRFSMGGSGVGYAWRVGLWTLLAAVTLGFAMPWRQAALERFKMRHTSYGTLQGRFDGTGAGLFKRGWWLWLLIWGLVVASATAIRYPALGVSAMVVLSVGAPFFYALYKAIEWRWWLSGLRLGDVSFESDLRTSDLIGLYWKVIGWSLLLIIGLSVWMGAVFGASYAQIGDAASGEEIAMLMLQQPAMLVAAAVGYVIFILLFWAVTRIYLIHDVWQRVTNSVTVHNLAAAVDVAQQGRAASAIGEGLADSLDIGGF